MKGVNVSSNYMDYLPLTHRFWLLAHTVQNFSLNPSLSLSCVSVLLLSFEPSTSTFVESGTGSVVSGSGGGGGGGGAPLARRGSSVMPNN